MNIANAISMRISKLLYEKNMSQYRLAKLTSLSESSLVNILHNRTKDMNATTIYLIASAFGMTLEQFFASPIFEPKNIEA